MTGFDVSVDVAMYVLGIGCMYLASNESSFVCVFTGKTDVCVSISQFLCYYVSIKALCSLL